MNNFIKVTFILSLKFLTIQYSYQVYQPQYLKTQNFKRQEVSVSIIHFVGIEYLYDFKQISSVKNRQLLKQPKILTQNTMLNNNIDENYLYNEQALFKDGNTDDHTAENQNYFKVYESPEQFYYSSNASQLIIDESYQQYLNVDLGVPQGQSSLLSQQGKLFKKISPVTPKNSIQAQKPEDHDQFQQIPMIAVEEYHEENFETFATKNLFTYKTIKKDKNTVMNFPKYLMRLLIKKAKTYENNLTSQQLSQLKPLFNRLYRLRYKSRQFNTELLEEFLSDNETVQPTIKTSMRKLMRIILQKSKREKIINNQHVRTKRDHLILSKIYNLRCLSSNLIGQIDSN